MVIFFDLDTTLLDHDAAARAGATKFYETFRPSFKEDLESFLMRWHEVGEKYFQTGEEGRELNHTQSRRARMRAVLSPALSDAEADASFKVYLKTYEDNWRMFPDGLPCLEALQDHQLGLITNGVGEQQRSKITKLGLDPYLSTVIISREVDCSKPDKAIFELAARESGTDIKNCVYVGDRLQTDALAAQQAGMRGIWLDRKNQWNGGEVGVPVIRTLAELPGLLELNLKENL
jgi:putative hydrolase of the HAD superfamily